MYLMYVDESGDIGLTGSPTRYFVLTGLVLHELRWRQTLDGLIAFRREQKNRFRSQAERRDPCQPYAFQTRWFGAYPQAPTA